jgi:hypothetical protein
VRRHVHLNRVPTEVIVNDSVFAHLTHSSPHFLRLPSVAMCALKPVSQSPIPKGDHVTSLASKLHVKFVERLAFFLFIVIVISSTGY